MSSEDVPKETNLLNTSSLLVRTVAEELGTLETTQQAIKKQNRRLMSAW
jgi:hypothetical protein